MLSEMVLEYWCSTFFIEGRLTCFEKSREQKATIIDKDFCYSKSSIAIAIRNLIYRESRYDVNIMSLEQNVSY